MTKRISIVSAIAFAAAVVLPVASFAQDMIPNAIVHDSRGNQVKDERGNCIRTTYGDHNENCGAAVAQVVQEPVAHTRLASVYFDFNKSTLNKKGRVTLNKLLRTLRNKKIEEVTISGYADALGSDSYNMALSKKRAEAVKHYLNAHGFKHADTEMHALGKKDADASCKGLKDGKLHACMQEDRRVDIEVKSVVKNAQ
ncbi:MAG TPA: OmpA family protein [Rickettsiales bacterium]|nr:OmpA family protein [Rickettsiales bacterium]